MIYAIPCDDDQVANHFMKAPQFALFDGQHYLNKIDNPAAQEATSCQAKNQTLALLKTMQADAVVVKAIGERALAKLLQQGIQVFKLSEKTSLTNATQSSMQALRSLEQARPSIQHQQKHNETDNHRGCCNTSEQQHRSSANCHGKHKQHAGKRCCQH